MYLFCPCCGTWLCRCECLRARPIVRELQALTIVSASAHVEPRAELIHRLKYRDETHLADWLGDTLLPGLTAFGQVDALVPVPLHAERLAERGYNQSALLAKRLAARRGLHVWTQGIQKVRRTAPQAELSASERTTNLLGAFRVDPSRFRGAQVLLIDDVVTTGSTALSLASSLALAGCAVVGMLTATSAQAKSQ
jgi:ComF family protein